MREITTGATAALVAALLGTSPAAANDRDLRATTVSSAECEIVEGQNLFRFVYPTVRGGTNGE